MTYVNEGSVYSNIEAQFGVNALSLEFQTSSNQIDALQIDVLQIRTYPLLRNGGVVAGAKYDVSTGLLSPVEC